jgi:ketosteroid isomerase-like protein
MVHPKARTVLLVLSVALNLVLLVVIGGITSSEELHDTFFPLPRVGQDVTEFDIMDQIQKMIDRETYAWEHEDVEALLSIFHADMVWPWPPDPHAHDPEGWEIGLGRYHHGRWTAVYRDLFDTYDLVHNRRNTVKIMASEEGDGAFAVVDIDTLWRDGAGNDSHWKGRVGKGYTLVNGEWKLIFHTGALDYEEGIAAVPQSTH